MPKKFAAPQTEINVKNNSAIKLIIFYEIIQESSHARQQCIIRYTVLFVKLREIKHIYTVLVLTQHLGFETP